MTIKELYEEAKAIGAEDYEIVCTHGSDTDRTHCPSVDDIYFNADCEECEL